MLRRQMKTIKNLTNGKIERVTDEVAHERTKSNRATNILGVWKYIPKSEWKKVVRDV